MEREKGREKEQKKNFFKGKKKGRSSIKLTAPELRRTCEKGLTHTLIAPVNMHTLCCECGCIQLTH